MTCPCYQLEERYAIMIESSVQDAKRLALQDTCPGCHEIMVFAWGNNEKRSTMKGRECHVLAHGKKRSVMIEFIDNGQREIVSFRSLRKRQSND